MFRCSLHDHKTFASGAIWQDYLAELEIWERDICIALEASTFNPASGEMEMRKEDRALYDEFLRGSLLAIRRVKALPGTIIGMLNDNNTETLTQEETNND